MNPKITESELELFELLRQDKLKDYEVFSKKEYKNIFRGIIEKCEKIAEDYWKQASVKELLPVEDM